MLPNVVESGEPYSCWRPIITRLQLRPAFIAESTKYPNILVAVAVPE